jgi:hypothetical protein
MSRTVSSRIWLAGLAVLKMMATPARAQTAEVKEKPPLYRFESYWTIPRARWNEVDKSSAAGNQILAPALAEGALAGYGNDSRAQTRFSFVLPSAQGLGQFRATLDAALGRNSLIAPAFGSMMVNYAPQADFAQVNAAYK